MHFYQKPLLYVILAALVISSVHPRDIDRRIPPSLRKTQIHDTGQFDGNQIVADLENNGMLVSHRLTGHSGLEWPAESEFYSIYAAGMWYAGKVGGDIRTMVAEYAPEGQSGPYGSDAADPSYRLYKINISDLEDPASNPDFAQWPIQQGAPWVDVDGDGLYTPMPSGLDHPDFIGDQVIFYIYNDGEAGSHQIFNTEPLGIEVRVTIWGYTNPLLANSMFIKQQIYNKGGEDITDMYTAMWSDPDLGSAGDDFVGCDPNRSLGFCYNDGADFVYGLNAPAIGFNLLQVAVPSADPSDEQFCFG